MEDEVKKRKRIRNTLYFLCSGRLVCILSYILMKTGLSAVQSIV